MPIALKCRLTRDTESEIYKKALPFKLCLSDRGYIYNFYINMKKSWKFMPRA